MIAFTASSAFLPLSAILPPKHVSKHVSRVPSGKRPPRAQLHLGGEPNKAGPGGGGVHIQASPEDRLLGELMFCEPDELGALISARRDVLNEDFFTYVNGKIDGSDDLEERTSLRLLIDAVKQLITEDDEKKKKKKSAAQTGVKAKDDGNKVSHNELIDYFVDASKREGGLKNAVVLRYENIDMRMLEVLEERILNASSDSESNTLKSILECITNEMQVRVNSAAERLRDLFQTQGGPGELRRKLRGIADSGGLDEAFVLLLQSNMDQAKKAENEGAVKMMEFLMEMVKDLLERDMPVEISLIRRLLRTESRDTRVEMLLDSFKPGKQVAKVGGEMSSGVKCDGKLFVIALRELIEKYGNLDKKFVERLSQIGEESEAVARKIYGMEGKDVKDLQNEAFHNRRLSVWDLEGVEISEQAQGRKAGWDGKMGAIPQGFNEDGKMTL